MRRGASAAGAAAVRLTDALDALDLTELRPGQREAVEASLAGRDVLAVMPTGSGKSAIYQLVAEMVSGPTLVVSPLVALQADQVASLAETDAGRAVRLNAQLSSGDRADALDAVRDGDVEYLFLAPEQLARPATLAAVRESRPSVLVVDEAHCITEWGHDFRPDYLRLGTVVEALGHPRVIALTATAAPPVQEEIVERLGLRDPLVLVTGFDRPNLDLTVRRHLTESDKDAAVVTEVTERAGRSEPGIVYVATRARSESLASRLQELGVPAAAYHAGLAARRRAETQRRFMAGEVTVMVATSAFGMGVDHPGLRFVVHADVPDALDAYAQEVGRAGRDGSPASGSLHYRPEDLERRRALAGRSPVSARTLHRVGAALAGSPEPNGAAATDLPSLAVATELHPRTVTAALTTLGEGVQLAADGTVTVAGPIDVAVAAAEERMARRRRHQGTRADMVRAYAESNACRHVTLVAYFGESIDRCDERCDNCRGGGVTATAEDAPVIDDVAATPGTPVEHATLGAGRIMQADEERVVVLFEESGYRTLATEVVVERDLLDVVDPDEGQGSR